MEWGKQEFRPRTLCGARCRHCRSAPKEPSERSNRFGKRVRSFTGLSRTAPRFCRRSTCLRLFASFLQSFFFQIKKKVESYGAERMVPHPSCLRQSTCLAAARSRSGNKSHSGFYLRPSRRFATHSPRIYKFFIKAQGKAWG